MEKREEKAQAKDMTKVDTIRAKVVKEKGGKAKDFKDCVAPAVCQDTQQHSVNMSMVIVTCVVNGGTELPTVPSRRVLMSFHRALITQQKTLQLHILSLSVPRAIPVVERWVVCALV